jgi:hypothetical protein
MLTCDHVSAYRLSCTGRRLMIIARLFLALSLTLGACAVANTPQQNLAYERWAKCNTAYANLQYVDLDGQMTVRISNTSTAQDVSQCLAEAGRGGPPLPPPVFVRPPGGP